MNTLKKHTRPLEARESKALVKIRKTCEKDLAEVFKLRYVLVAIVFGLGCAYLAYWTKYGFLTFVFGAVSALSFMFVVSVPYDIYKTSRRLKSKIKQIDVIMSRGTVDVCPVQAKRIALAKEKKDEGDWFIIEMDDNRLLHLWDLSHELKKALPCLTFEIYDDDFYAAIGKPVNALSEKTQPAITISAKAKLAYLAKLGMPEHMRIEKKNFDKLVEEINKAAVKAGK